MKTLRTLFIIFLLVSVAVLIFINYNAPANNASEARAAAPAKSLMSNDCPTTGLRKNKTEPAGKTQQLNLHKNRESAPDSSQINASVTLEGMLNSGDDDSKFSNDDGAAIEGYIFKAKLEGGESCNCYSDEEVDHDIHVYISDHPDAQGIGECAVVEITPYTHNLHPEWTAEYINSLKGRKVRITGWMLYDWEHVGESYDSHPDGAHVYRKTVWEIHPVTGMKVVE